MAINYDKVFEMLLDNHCVIVVSTPTNIANHETRIRKILKNNALNRKYKISTDRWEGKMYIWDKRMMFNNREEMLKFLPLSVENITFLCEEAKERNNPLELKDFLTSNKSHRDKLLFLAKKQLIMGIITEERYKEIEKDLTVQDVNGHTLNENKGENNE